MAVLAGFAKWRAAVGVGLHESSRRTLIKRAVVFLELEGVMAALGADRLGHFRVTVQCVGGGDAAFQIKAFQGFEGRLDLVAVGACERGERKPRLSVPHADHERWHERAAALIAVLEPFAVDGDDAGRRAKPERVAQRLGEGGEGARHLVGFEKAKQARETIVARRPVRQGDDLGEVRLVGGAKIGDVDATLRPAQSRHQGDEQHRGAIMAGVSVAGIANLTKNGNQRLHRSLLESHRIKRPPQELPFTFPARSNIQMRFPWT